MVVRVGKSFRFEASHVLPKHPGKCSRLHGHSWVGQVVVEGPVDPETGFVVDYADLSELIRLQIVERCDHTHLGQSTVQYYDWSGGPELDFNSQAPFGQNFYPSSENLVVAFARILQPLVLEFTNGGNKGNVVLAEVSLKETCTSEAIWRAKP